MIFLGLLAPYIFTLRPIQVEKLLRASQGADLLVADDKDYITIENLDFRYSNTFGVRGYNGSAHWILRNSDIYYAFRNGFNMGGSGQTDTLIDGVDISYSGGSGINLASYNTHWTIQNSTIHHNCQLNDPTYHNYQAGIYAGTVSVDDIIIQNNTFYSNGVFGATGVSNGAAIWLDGHSGVGTDSFQSAVTPSLVR